MQYIIYFLLALASTTVGALTGLGGGVIIKPLMDVLGDYDAQTIGVVSSITVFTMAIVSILKQLKAKTVIPFSTAIPLSVGSIVGGFFGQKVLNFIIDKLNADSIATVVQNIVLAILILGVIIYMKNKSRIRSRNFSGITVCLAVGLFLGFCSSFLGIGGGPINVALMIYLFSFDTKTATVCSIVTVLFAQISKLATTAIVTGFAVYDLSVVPLMAIGAVMGGFIGASLNKKCSEKTVEKAFNGVQIFVLIIAIFNIVRNIISV